MKIVKIILWVFVGTVLLFTIYLLSGLGNVEAQATTNISSVFAERSAWNDLIGWIDFYDTNSIIVNSTKLSGYASSSIGDVSLDCATTRPPSNNICGTSNYGICNGLAGIKNPSNDGSCLNSDGSGNLMGYAWNDLVGWISFNCRNHETSPCITPYGVTINPSNGNFSGWAWNDTIGWISFNQTAPIPYMVKTLWQGNVPKYGYLTSAILDTKLQGGSQLNSFIWDGYRPNGARVDFQIAVSNSPSGPWDYFGPGGSAENYYGLACPIVGSASLGAWAEPKSPICVDSNRTKGFRYMRYRVRLVSNLLQTDSPRVDDIILNWSR